MLEQCGACGTRFAAGLPACPHCWTPLDGDDGDDEEADVAKITHAGVSIRGNEPAPEEPQEPELVPVAVQKAAGVPPEETVTLADQKAGVPPPELPAEPPPPPPEAADG